MKNIVLIITVGLLLALSSCIPSLHGIVTDETRVTDDRILGTWNISEQAIISVDASNDSSVSETTLWTFERAANITLESPDGSHSVALRPGTRSMANGDMLIKSIEELSYYFLTHKECTTGDTVTTKLLVHLTHIGDQLYMDFLPCPLESKELSGRFASNYLYAHTFAKCTFVEDDLVIHPFDGEYILDLIEQKRIRLKHELIDDEESIVLTASTDELRAFIEKYGNDSNLYENVENLTRWIDQD